MTPLIDTHSHIYLEQFAGETAAIVQRARDAGVETIIVPATRPEEFEAVLDLAATYPEVRAAVGVHPHHASEIGPDALTRVEELCREGRAIAVGEAGLDYYYDFAPRDRQREVLQQQLRIAKRVGLPAILHNRDSDDDLLEILEAEQDGHLRFQLHCFSSSPAVLDRALELGGMISFTGNVTFAKSTLDEVVRSVPDDRIMIETDAPYLAPAPFRGKRNEPSMVALVAERIAAIRGQAIETVRQMTSDNARRFFHLALSIFVLASFASVANAQTGAATRPGDTTGQTVRGPAPVRSIDTTRRSYNRLLGLGGHIASSTYISGATTKATAVGQGFWITSAPLQSLGINWLNIDVIYTHVIVGGVVDSSFDYWRKKLGEPNAPPPDNIHNSLDIALRLVANPSAVVNFFATFGATNFDNEFGNIRYIYQKGGDTSFGGYRENVWGINGGVGVSGNYRLPYVTLTLLGEMRILRVMQERPLWARSDEFFVSQIRAALLVYPDFSAIFR